MEQSAAERKRALERDLDPLFKKAEAQGLWFYSHYQQLWFSPAKLRAEQAGGSFRWGSANWTLRDPMERVRELRRDAEGLNKIADAIEKEVTGVEAAR